MKLAISLIFIYLCMICDSKRLRNNYPSKAYYTDAWGIQRFTPLNSPEDSNIYFDNRDDDDKRKGVAINNHVYNSNANNNNGYTTIPNNNDGYNSNANNNHVYNSNANYNNGYTSNPNNNNGYSSNANKNNVYNSNANNNGYTSNPNNNNGYNNIANNNNVYNSNADNNNGYNSNTNNNNVYSSIPPQKVTLEQRFNTENEPTEVKLLGPGTTEVEQLNNITFAITNFAVNLMKSVSALQKGNIIISPTSVTTVLALLQQGTYGESQDQITEALQLAPTITAPTYKRLTTDMQKRVSRNILTVANNLYLAEGFEINEPFKVTATKNFGSEVSLLNNGQPALAVRQINKWVASKTNNKIENLLSEDAISPTTQLVIVNAVYFKGLWETKFKPDATKDMEFHFSNGQKQLIPFMRQLNNLKNGVDEDLQACVVILPFERNQYSLIIILPDETTNVVNVLHSLTNTKLVDYHKFAESEVRLDLPKFTLKSDTDLIPVLKKMGMSGIFDPQTDLSGIGTYRTFSPRISNAFHSGFMSVDEQGVSASAASAFAGVALSFDPTSVQVTVNRPFVAVLWDTQFAIPLFIARIEDPRS